MLKILGVFNEIKNTTIPIENFVVLSEDEFTKHAYSYSTNDINAWEVINKGNACFVDKLFAVGNLPTYKRISIIYRLIQTENYDIIHIHHTLSSLLVVMITYILGSKAKIVFTVHNDYKYYKWWQKVIFRIVLGNADYIICNSINTRRSIAKICSQENISVIYNGVNTDIIPQLFKDKSKIIKLLFAARLVPQKNVMQLLRAIHELSGDKLKFEFILVGDGPEMGLVKDYVKKNNLSSHVEIKGKLKRDEVYDLMNYADVFIVPSIFEGFCNAMVEAMLCRCVIVASNIQPLPEVTGGEQNAIFFDLNDSNDLFQTLKNIILDVERYRSFATKGMIFAQSQYSLNNCASNHSNLYKKLVNVD